MPWIDGLPHDFPLADGSTVDLRQVPDGPKDPMDPDRDQLRQDWRDWADRVRRVRKHRFDLCNNDDDQQAIEFQKCKRYGAAYFAVIWGWMFDPRMKDGRPIGPTPFIPYPFQIEMFSWLDERLSTTGPLGDGVISKSRDMGATWCCCLWSLHGWFFRESFQARLVSRKEELVDRKNDMDSMFAKIDFMLARLPVWMMPDGFLHDFHRMQLRLKNPENENAITGEATTSKTLRGGRATVAFYDEAAFIPGFTGVWTTGANATDHRIAVSSESLEEGPDFQRLGEKAEGSVRPAFLALNYWIHPEHDDRWYLWMKERMAADPEGFAREVERNASAGFGEYIYEIAQHYTSGNFPYVEGTYLHVGIDPGFDDECALVFLAYDVHTGRFRVVESFANRLQPPEYYASILAGYPVEGIDGFDYRPYGPHDPLSAMELMRTVSDFTIFGDPAGSNRVTGERDSWYDRMNDWSQRHSRTRRGLSVVYKWDNDRRGFTGRRAALSRLLPRCDFNDTPGVRSLLYSLREYRFERGSKERMAEQVKPLHNSNSHLVSAFEYIAVNLEVQRDVSDIGTLGIYDAA